MREGCEFRYASDAVVDPITFWSKRPRAKWRSYVVVVPGAYVLTPGLRDPARVGATDLENLVFDQYKRWVPETTN